MRGCTKISQGCKNCYAEMFAKRFEGIVGPWEQGFEPRFVQSALDLPKRWTEPRLVFVNSVSDIFHEAFTDEQIRSVFRVMAECPQHRFQVLTKRPERLASLGLGMVPQNALLGVSCENQVAYEDRCRVMKAAGVARWFVSFEPLLERIEFHSFRSNVAWAIVGAESGRGARPFHLDWARAIRDVCRAFRIPFFFKQILDDRGRKVSLPLLDGMRWNQQP